MNITLDNIMPTPLASIQHASNSIWGNLTELKAGSHVLLNASSGKGKSTFTMTTIGLRNDYTGEIRYNDSDIKTFTEEEWTTIRQKEISVVFQDLQLFPNLSVAENLQLKNDLEKVYNSEQLKEQLTVLGIGDKWGQKCGLLSMGQQQRVAIIRALSQPFKWLILDEPFSHLDEENTQICLRMIKNRCEEMGAGFVLTTLGDTHGYDYHYELKL